MSGFFLNSKGFEVVTMMLLTIYIFFRRSAVRHLLSAFENCFKGGLWKGNYCKTYILRIEAYDMTMKSVESRGICLPKLKKTMQCLRSYASTREWGKLPVWIQEIFLFGFWLCCCVPANLMLGIYASSLYGLYSAI